MLKYLRLLGNRVHSVFSQNKYREWLGRWMDGQTDGLTDNANIKC